MNPREENGVSDMVEQQPAVPSPSLTVITCCAPQGLVWYLVGSVMEVMAAKWVETVK